MAILTPASGRALRPRTVVVRAGLYVDPTTAQITAISDPIPTILDGVPLDVRSIAVNSRATSSPSTRPVASAATATGTAVGAVPTPRSATASRSAAASALPSSRDPLKVSGGTKRSKNPALRAVVSQARAKRTSPKPPSPCRTRSSSTTPTSDGLHQGAVRRRRGTGRKMPGRLDLRHATPITPLIAGPLTGNVYLRSCSHELPDLVVALNGPPPADPDRARRPHRQRSAAASATRLNCCPTLRSPSSP